MRPFILLVAILLAAPLPLHAQALADRVPGEALVYVGWQGTEALGPAYEQSHLKALVDSSNVRQFCAESLPAVFTQIEAFKPNLAPILHALQPVLSALWRHPTAIFFGGVGFDGPGGALPRLGVICKAGSQAEALRAHVGELLAQGIPFPVQTFVDDGALVVAVGYGPADLPGAARPSIPSLTQNQRFQAALAKVQKDAVFTLHVDWVGTWDLIDRATKQRGDIRDAEQWVLIRDGLGLAGMHSLTTTGGFDGKEWGCRSFIAAPTPRGGVMKVASPSQALSDDLLRLVPMTATSMRIGCLDLAGVFLGIKEIVAKFDANTEREFDEFLAQAEKRLGFNIERDFLQALGEEWALYTDPASGPNGLLGFTIINRPKSPQQVEKVISQLELMGNNLLAMFLGKQGMRLAFETFETCGAKIHYLAAPGVAPAWGTREGTLYIGLYPQVVAGAMTHASRKGKSILENEKFVALRKRLGGSNIDSLSFDDLPRTIPESYGTILFLSQCAFGAMNLFGCKTPPLTVPILPEIAPHLTPAGEVSWSDDAGCYVRSVTPFPGATVAGQNSFVIIGATSMLAGIIVPAVTAGWEKANQVASMSNLKSIGTLLGFYAEAHKGRFPRDLGRLFEFDEAINLDLFLSPKSGKDAPGAIIRAD